MKLLVKRNQKAEKGLFGGEKGMKFLLNCRVELTPEENELIKKYKADGEMLALIKIEGDPKQTGILLINHLIAGKTYECKDVVGLLEIEEKMNHSLG